MDVDHIRASVMLLHILGVLIVALLILAVVMLVFNPEDDPEDKCPTLKKIFER